MNNDKKKEKKRLKKEGKKKGRKKERKTKRVGICGGILFVTCWFAVEPLFILRFISPPRLFSTPDLNEGMEGKSSSV